MQSATCEMPGWMKHKLESRLPGEISIMPICRSFSFLGREEGLRMEGERNEGKQKRQAERLEYKRTEIKFKQE